VLEKLGRVVGHGETVAIDLTVDYEQMWAMTRSNHRRQISRTRKLGMKTVIDDWSRLETFVDIYHETMRRVGAIDFYFFDRGYFDELRSALCDAVHLMVVESPEGDVLCGGIFFERCGIIQYHLGATRNEALPLGPTKQMFDDVRKWAKERGNKVLHLGGGVSVEGNPLFHFKAGFSDWHLPFHTWRIVTDDDAYAELCAARAPGVDIGDVTQFFPLYRLPTA
jgi:lipid II:glycine glycyltransferase (peptidoglycan interpeptide bridge formation enzyme)